MKYFMSWIFKTLVPFFCGSIVVMNLTGLVQVNHNYEHEWWKVALALMFFIVVPLLSDDP